MAYTWYIHGICMVYALHMYGICKTYCISWFEILITAKQVMKVPVQSLLRTQWLAYLDDCHGWGHHMCQTQSLCNQEMFLTCIYQVYTRYICVISPQQHPYWTSLSPKHAWKLQTWTVSGSFLFLQWKSLQLEAVPLWPSICWSQKYGCPWVMQGLDCSTCKFKGLLKLCSVVLWLNGRGGLAIKEAWKEWQQSKVFHPANKEHRDKQGLIQLPNSVWLIPYTKHVLGICLPFTWYMTKLGMEYDKIRHGIWKK